MLDLQELVFHWSHTWRVTLLSIQPKSLKIVTRRTMDKMLSILRQVNPACGIREVEFSLEEIKRFRVANIQARKPESADLVDRG